MVRIASALEFVFLYDGGRAGRQGRAEPNGAAWDKAFAAGRAEISNLSKQGPCGPGVPRALPDADFSGIGREEVEIECEDNAVSLVEPLFRKRQGKKTSSDDLVKTLFFHRSVSVTY